MVTVTDTSSNPDGYALTYEWQKNYQSGALNPDVRTGSPECLNAECSRASWTYASPGTYFILEKVSWPEDSGYVWHSVVVEGPPEEIPADITLVGPSVRTLPTDLEMLSPKIHMVGAFSCHTGPFGGPIGEPCEPYFLTRTGPDESGLYHYIWRLPTAAPGEVTMQMEAWNSALKNADRVNVTFTATSSGLAFGDAHTCLAPHLLAKGGGLAAFELDYYSQRSSTAVVLRQDRVGGKWTAPKPFGRKEFRVGGKEGLTPFTRRTFRVRVKESDLLKGRLRVFYSILRGRHQGQSGKRIGKLTGFSTETCTAPGGI